MNWTGGALNRSKGINSSVLAIQKRHFAKLRNNRISERKFLPINPASGELHFYNGVKEAVIHKQSIKQGSYGEDVAKSSLDVDSLPREVFKDVDHGACQKHARISELESCSPPKRRGTIWREKKSPSLSTRASFDIDSQRRKLLERGDWVGIGPTRPAKINFISAEDRDQIGKRRRLDSSRRHFRHQAIRRPYKQLSHYHVDNYQREDSPEVSVRIGSAVDRPQDNISAFLEIHNNPISQSQDAVSEDLESGDPQRQSHSMDNFPPMILPEPSSVAKQPLVPSTSSSRVENIESTVGNQSTTHAENEVSSAYFQSEETQIGKLVDEAMHVIRGSKADSKRFRLFRETDRILSAQSRNVQHDLLDSGTPSSQDFNPKDNRTSDHHSMNVNDTSYKRVSGRSVNYSRSNSLQSGYTPGSHSEGGLHPPKHESCISRRSEPFNIMKDDVDVSSDGYTFVGDSNEASTTDEQPVLANQSSEDIHFRATPNEQSPASPGKMMAAIPAQNPEIGIPITTTNAFMSRDALHHYQSHTPINIDEGEKLWRQFIFGTRLPEPKGTPVTISSKERSPIDGRSIEQSTHPNKHQKLSQKHSSIEALATTSSPIKPPTHSTPHKSSPISSERSFQGFSSTSIEAQQSEESSTYPLIQSNSDEMLDGSGGNVNEVANVLFGSSMLPQDDKNALSDEFFDFEAYDHQSGESQIAIDGITSPSNCRPSSMHKKARLKSPPEGTVVSNQKVSHPDPPAAPTLPPRPQSSSSSFNFFPSSPISPSDLSDPTILDVANPPTPTARVTLTPPKPPPPSAILPVYFRKPPVYNKTLNSHHNHTNHYKQTEPGWSNRKPDGAGSHQRVDNDKEGDNIASFSKQIIHRRRASRGTKHETREHVEEIEGDEIED